MLDITIPVSTVLVLIWLHFIGDVVLQSKGLNYFKNKDISYLVHHSTLATIPFIWFGLKFVCIVWCTHIVIDYCISYMLTLNRGKSSYSLVVTGGFDQALHLSAIFITYILVFTLLVV